ncbi:hypothetical protein SLEP1_g7723 [Rubroshorea leprosula]|uniref:Uncharacterized protein n=1 Tax=Rubroshorea leprosula TaxID=152421 RepID=A0AAV5I5L1_9ROSI|nr:hypothetical protein SLEP1_g7723 [Rubroshorea leprosula]
MALPLPASVPVAAISSRLPFPPSCTKHYAPSRVTALKLSNELTMRRSADYKPPIWSFEYIQSLKVDYVEESFRRRIQVEGRCYSGARRKGDGQGSFATTQAH